MILLPFLIVFRSEPVKFATKLFELGLDRVALRLNGVVVFPERAQLRDDPIAVATERLVINFQDADILGGQCPQGLSDCRVLGTEPLVLLPFLIVLRSEPVKFATKLFELGLDRVALRLNGVAVFPERAQLRDDPIAVATERLVFCSQDANILGGRCPQRLSDCRQLGTEPLVLRPVVVTFRLEQLILAQKPLELGTDGVAFHPDPNAVLLESAEIGEHPTELPTDRLEFTLGDSPCGLAGLRVGMSVFELPVKLVQRVCVNICKVRLSLRLHRAWDQELFFALAAPDISTCISGTYPQGGRTGRTNHRHTINLGTDRHTINLRIDRHTINLGTDRVHHQDGGRGFVVTRDRRKIRARAWNL